MLEVALKGIMSQKFKPSQQHDAHEFMVFLFAQLQEEETPLHMLREFNGTDPNKPLEQSCNEYEKSHPSIIDRTFSGMQRTTVTCGKCSH